MAAIPIRRRRCLQCVILSLMERAQYRTAVLKTRIEADLNGKPDGVVTLTTMPSTYNMIKTVMVFGVFKMPASLLLFIRLYNKPSDNPMLQMYENSHQIILFSKQNHFRTTRRFYMIFDMIKGSRRKRSAHLENALHFLGRGHS